MSAVAAFTELTSHVQARAGGLLAGVQSYSAIIPALYAGQAFAQGNASVAWAGTALAVFNVLAGSQLLTCLEKHALNKPRPDVDALEATQSAYRAGRILGMVGAAAHIYTFY